MYPTSYSIDWFTGVCDAFEQNRIGNALVASEWLPCKGGNGYDTAYEDYVTGIKRMNSSTRVDMGYCFLASGKPLNNLLECLHEEDYIEAMKMYGLDRCRASRIDLTLDIHDGGLLAHTLADNLERGTLKHRTRKPSVTRGFGEDKGVTTYIGSRTSPKMIRIYDKFAQSKGLHDSTRIEIECKDSYSASLWKMLCDSSDKDALSKAFKGVLRTLITDFGPNVNLDAILSEKPLSIKPVTEKQTDLKAWLLKQVVPCLVKSVVNEPREESLLTWLINQVRAQADNTYVDDRSTKSDEATC